jgi:ATP-binding cassette subfamily B protein
MGWFDGLDAESYDRTYTDRELLGRIWPYFMRQGPRLFVAMILVMLMAGAGAGEPMVVGYGLDWVDEDGRLRASVFLVVGIFAIGLAWWFLRWLNRRTMARLVGGVVRDMQTDAFGAAIGHDLAFYDQTESGKVVSRITSDTQEFSQLVDQVTQVLYQLVEIVMLLFVLLSIDVGLTLWLLSVIPVVLAFAMLFRFVARNLTRKGMRAIADVNASVKESVAGIAVTKNFRQEGSVYEEFAAINRRSYGANLWRGLIMNMVFPILTGIGGIGIGLVVYQGGISVLRGAVMVGQWYLFLQSLDRIMYPMMQLSSFWTQIQTGLAAAERIFALIDAEPTVVQTGDLPVPEVRGSIQFEHVHFRYREEEPVLADFSLHIQPGETVAFVGHTGAGKSSLARLIARFYEFQAGRILLDGQDLRELDLVAYRPRRRSSSRERFWRTSAMVARTRRGRRSRTSPMASAPANGCGPCHGAWIPMWANAARCSPWASASWSPSCACSCASPASSCSTKPRPASTPSPSARSRRRSS